MAELWDPLDCGKPSNALPSFGASMACLSDDLSRRFAGSRAESVGSVVPVSTVILAAQSR